MISRQFYVQENDAAGWSLGSSNTTKKDEPPGLAASYSFDAVSTVQKTQSGEGHGHAYRLCRHHPDRSLRHGFRIIVPRVLLELSAQ